MDVLSPQEEATAGRYRQLALTVLDGLRQRNRLPIFTAGTDCICARCSKVSRTFRSARKNCASGCARALKSTTRPSASNPEAARLGSAKKIAPADEQKLIRAVEVCVLTRKPVSEVLRAGRTPLEAWHVLKVGLMPPREKLNERIHSRIDTMLEQGWMREVQALLDSGLNEDSKPFDFIGYREIARGAPRRD